jgi:hypothetical protein
MRSCLNTCCVCFCRMVLTQAGQSGPGGISAGFTALCSSYQQMAGTGIGPDVLEAATATPNASKVRGGGWGGSVCQL